MKAILYLWQLPQHLVALCLWGVLRAKVVDRQNEGGRTILFCFHRFGGLSLGHYLFVHRDAGPDLIRHELGHCRQSMLLGPTYLLVIGLPSLAWAALYGVLQPRRPDLDYFRFYTEAWADRLAPPMWPPRSPAERS